MCRMAAYAGAPAPVDHLFTGFPHGLERQAYAPRELLSGHVNVDGTGLVCWPLGARAPLRHATALPPWNDANLRDLGAALSAPLQLAAVRSGTPGQAFGREAAAPFLRDGVALAHNGFVKDFAARGLPALLEGLPRERWGTAGAPTDSNLLFAHLLQARREHPTAPLDEALRTALTRVGDAVRAAGLEARLDVLACDGAELVAARSAVGLESNTLYAAGLPEGGLILASEPLDPALEWRALDDGEMFVHRFDAQ